MKKFLTRCLLVATVTLVAFALTSSARAQQSGEDSVTASPRQPQSPTTPAPSQQTHDASPSSDPQTQDALAFTGSVVQEQNQFVLKDPVTKMSYQLDDQSKAKRYLGKHVRIIGKLEMNSNTIHIDRIELLS